VKEKSYRLRLIENRSVLAVVHGEVLSGDVVGGLILPPNLDVTKALVRHICASVEYAPGKWSQSAADKKHHVEWQRRNDYADALVYARTGAYEWETNKPLLPQYDDEKKPEPPPPPMIDEYAMGDNWILG